MRILGLETSCDETGAAVLEGPDPPSEGVPRLLSSVVASQFELHRPFGGIVPEVASRAHVRNLLPVVDRALREAETTLAELAAVAVTTRPGLVGSLIVGLAAAKALAIALEIPLIAVDHLEGHLYSCQLAHPEESVFPCVGMVVSGGHTSLYECRSPLLHHAIGGTIDDAAGEAFDKVASLLGLGFPGGPAIERAARDGDPGAFAFPRAFLHDDRLDFSFSGLKTAVLYTWRARVGPADPAAFAGSRLIADLAASFQEAVVDILAVKARQALRKTRLGALGVGGGVVANACLRERLTRMADEESARLFIPPLSLCTDNGALAAIAFPKLANGEVAGLDLDVSAGLIRPGRG